MLRFKANYSFPASLLHVKHLVPVVLVSSPVVVQLLPGQRGQNSPAAFSPLLTYMVCQEGTFVLLVSTGSFQKTKVKVTETQMLYEPQGHLSGTPIDGPGGSVGLF